jgi:hypothetical protein
MARRTPARRARAKSSSSRVPRRVPESEPTAADALRQLRAALEMLERALARLDDPTSRRRR